MNRRRGLAAATVLGLLLATVAYLAWPVSAGGSTGYVVTHGISMQPRFHTGDLAILRTADQYHVGDIVGYHSTTLHTVVMHRIVAEHAGHFTMKGDNNHWLDPDHPVPSQIVGKLAIQIPGGGIWFSRLTSPAALALVLFLLLAAGSATTQHRRRRRKAGMSRHAFRRTGPSRSLFPIPRHLHNAAGMVAATAVLGLALAALAFHGPATTETPHSTPTNDTLTFGYSATVRKSAAYDSTTITSPAPVFRRLATGVALHLVYRGDPGTMTVSYELGSATSWHTSQVVARGVKLTGKHDRITLPLDLTAIDARAAAASAAIGMPSTSVPLTIASRITTNTHGVFTPTAALNITPLQLTVTGDAKTLTATNPATVSTITTAPRALNFAGHHLAIATARKLAALLLLAALLAAIALAAVARRSSPDYDNQAIRRRNARLLASVQPIMTPDDLPVIDVSEFATLARLAERADRMILHWRDAEMETFLLLDEGTAYRYCTLTTLARRRRRAARAALVTTPMPAGLEILDH